MLEWNSYMIAHPLPLRNLCCAFSTLLWSTIVAYSAILAALVTSRRSPAHNPPQWRVLCWAITAAPLVCWSLVLPSWMSSMSRPALWSGFHGLVPRERSGRRVQRTNLVFYFISFNNELGNLTFRRFCRPLSWLQIRRLLLWHCLIRAYDDHILQPF